MDDNRNINTNNNIDNVERYAYCLCLHVRPTTIFISLVNLGGALICAIVTLALMSYSDNPSWQHMSDTQRSAHTTLAIIIYMMLATVSAMLLYGVIKSRPSYILPFFGIQFIDFLFTLPQFLSSLYDHPEQRNQYSHFDRVNSQMHSSNGLFDLKHVWPNVNSNHANVTSLLLSTMIVLFKLYFLCVVWKCYRYLRMKEMILPLHLPFHTANVNDLLSSTIMVPPPNLAPPCYDEATKNSAPPDYETATRNDEFKFIPLTPPRNSYSESQLQSHLSQSRQETQQQQPQQSQQNHSRQQQ